ncbi:MAG: alpha-E domain-containing protein [Gammaproteobacteria bacterium]|nr:alpha-E domain-containing protein [Gammaproteobacteria bacterium]
MLSRIAESVYWMSRFLERTDNTARLLDINLTHLLEADEAGSEELQWAPLLHIVAGNEVYQRIFPDGAVTGARMIRYMVQEKGNSGSIYAALKGARENARVARDRVSKEMWEALNEFWLQVDGHVTHRLSPERESVFFKHVRAEVARFHGLTVSTMLRGDAFSFYLLGTFLERADMTARILDVKYHRLLPDVAQVGSPLDYYQWGALLKSLSGFEAYRRHYHGGIRPLDVVDLVVFSRHFPRSLHFAVDRMTQAIQEIGTSQVDCAVCRALEGLSALLTARAPEEVVREGLHEFLTDYLDQLSTLHASLQNEYFEAHLGMEQCVI